MLGSHPFESDTEMSDIDDDDRETLFSSMDLLSPGGHSDAQTLAMMLQEQLDAINKEIRSEINQHQHLYLNINIYMQAALWCISKHCHSTLSTGLRTLTLFTFFLWFICTSVV